MASGFCALILLWLYVGGSKAIPEWSYSNSYGHLDPKHWYLSYERCDGSRQSPIDIELDDLYEDPTLGPLVLSNDYLHRRVVNATLQNDGHTVRVTLPHDANLELKSFSLPAPYRLRQFHFHWSHNDDTGSEHKVDKKYFPLELHLVHFHENLTDAEAQFTDASIVVVAVLFKWTPYDRDRTYETAELNHIIDILADVEDEGDNMTLPFSLNITELLPSNTDAYLRYSGSLTTPPCSEVVEWILFSQTLNVSHHQMEQFRRLRHEEPIQLKQTRAFIEGEIEIETNDRPLADLNNRKIRVFGGLGDLFPDTILHKARWKPSASAAGKSLNGMVSFGMLIYIVISRCWLKV